MAIFNSYVSLPEGTYRSSKAYVRAISKRISPQNMAQKCGTESQNLHFRILEFPLIGLKLETLAFEKIKGLLWNHFWSDYWIWLVSTCSGSCASYSSYLVGAGVSERWNLYRGLPGTRKAKRGSQKSWFISRGNCFPSGRNLTLPLFLLGSCCIISNFEESLSWYSNRTCSTPVFQIHIKKKKKRKKKKIIPKSQNPKSSKIHIPSMLLFP